jgi:mannobiose 2-epimerase
MNSSIQSKPIPETINTRQLRTEFRQELDNILHWWLKNMVDHEHGGFYGRMDGHGVLHPKAEKGIILNTRLLWTFAAAARQSGNPVFKNMADRAFDYLLQFFWDELEGGVLWSVDFQGNPLNTQKQIYAQAFAIYALSEFYLLTQNREALDKANEIFWLIEKYSLDRKKGGYLTAFDRDWSGSGDIRLSEKDASAAKIMNTHLHILEAYTNFYRAQPTAAVKERLRYILEIYLDRFYRPDDGSLYLYFDENWQPKNSDTSFGHDIESSWLLWEAAEVLGDDDLLERTKPVSIHLAEAVLQHGLDADGGLFNERHADGRLDTDKHWWHQTEAVTGFWNAWELSGQEDYAETAARSWSIIKKFIIDAENGEWHWRVNRAGMPILSEDKAGPWKASYHNGRMCMEMVRRMK